MWGNKEGWLVSVLIVGLMSWWVWDLSKVAKPSPPSGAFKDLTAPIELPIKPEDVVNVMTDDRDAGDLYWQAIDQYLAEPQRYKSFLTPRKRAAGEPAFSITGNVDKVPAVQLLVDASTAAKATIFIRKPETLVNYKYPYPELEAIYTLGQIAGQIGFAYAMQADDAGATKYLHAQFSLGKKLFDERLNQPEALNGVLLMRGATSGLMRLAEKKKDTARRDELERFDLATKNYYETRIDKLGKAVVSIGQNDINRYAGDVFLLAKSSPDRMWRVEALLKVGRYKYNAGTTGDQVWATRFLSEPQRVGEPDPSQHPDPAVKLAATIARDLTLDQYNQIDFTD